MNRWMLAITASVSLLVLGPGGTALGRGKGRPPPTWRAERYQAAHDALVPRTKQLLLQARDLGRQLRALGPNAAGRPELERDVTVNRTHARKLHRALKTLKQGRTIGQCLRALNGEIKAKQRRLRKLRGKGLLARLKARRGRALPEGAAAVAEKQRLTSEISGLRLAAADLLDSSTGWRGTQVIPELGLHGLVPMVGMVGVRAGVQINGSDTGLFPVKPYVRGQMAGSVGPASVRGTAVVGGINGVYPSGGVQTPVGGIEYTPSDPVAGSDKLSMRTFAVSVGMTRRGVEGGFGVPLLPLLGTASVLVQNGAAKKISKKLRNGGFVKKFRDSSPTLDKALSDTPPPAAELFRGFRAEQAQRKQARRERKAQRKQARRERVARWKQAWRKWARRERAQ